MLEDLFASLGDHLGADVDARHELRLSAIDAAIGCRRAVAFTRRVRCGKCVTEARGFFIVASRCGACQNGYREAAESLTVTVPAGIASGQVLRLRGKGHDRPDAGAGDLYIAIQVDPAPALVRRGDHVTLEAVIGARHVLVGGPLEVAALDGRATVVVPRGVRDGDTVTIPGRGHPKAGAEPYRSEGARGDQIVTLRVPLALRSLRLKVAVGP